MDNNNVSCSLCNEPAVITDNKHNYCLDHYSDRKTLKALSKKIIKIEIRDSFNLNSIFLLLEQVPKPTSPILPF